MTQEGEKNIIRDKMGNFNVSMKDSMVEVRLHPLLDTIWERSLAKFLVRKRMPSSLNRIAKINFGYVIHMAFPKLTNGWTIRAC